MWNRGQPKVPGSGTPLPSKDLEEEIIRLYYREYLSPELIAAKLNLGKQTTRTGKDGRVVVRVLRRQGLPIRNRSEAQAASTVRHQRAGTRVRRGPVHTKRNSRSSAVECVALPTKPCRRS